MIESPTGLIVTLGQHAADAQELVALAKLILERAVIAERMRGTDWQAIGDTLDGITRSAAHGRFSAATRAFQARTDHGRRLRAETEVGEAWGRLVVLAERRARRDEILAAAVAMES